MARFRRDPLDAVALEGEKGSRIRASSTIRRQKRLTESDLSIDVPFSPPLVYIGLLIVGIVIGNFILITVPPSVFALTVGISLALVGVYLLVNASRAFARADTPRLQTSQGARDRGTVPLHKEPDLHFFLPYLRWSRGRLRIFCGPVATLSGHCPHRPHDHSTRGAVPRAKVRGGISPLQGEGSPLDLEPFRITAGCGVSGSSDSVPSFARVNAVPGYVLDLPRSQALASYFFGKNFL